MRAGSGARRWLVGAADASTPPGARRPDAGTGSTRTTRSTPATVACSPCSCAPPEGGACSQPEITFYADSGCQTPCGHQPLVDMTCVPPMCGSAFTIGSSNPTGGGCAPSGGTATVPAAATLAGVACPPNAALSSGSCSAGQICLPTPSTPAAPRICIRSKGEATSCPGSPLYLRARDLLRRRAGRRHPRVFGLHLQRTRRGGVFVQPAREPHEHPLRPHVHVPRRDPADDVQRAERLPEHDERGLRAQRDVPPRSHRHVRARGRPADRNGLSRRTRHEFLLHHPAPMTRQASAQLSPIPRDVQLAKASRAWNDRV